MAREGRGSVYQMRNKFFIYVPLIVSSDSMFSFRKGDKVIVKILGPNELTIKKLEQTSTRLTQKKEKSQT